MPDLAQRCAWSTPRVGTRPASWSTCCISTAREQPRAARADPGRAAAFHASLRRAGTGRLHHGGPAACRASRAAAAGRGQIDLPAILRRLPPDMPLALEVPMTSLAREIGPEAVARRAREAADRLLNHRRTTTWSPDARGQRRCPRPHPASSPSPSPARCRRRRTTRRCRSPSPSRSNSTQAAFEAGATLAHLHVRNDDGTPTSDPARFARTSGRPAAPLPRHDPAILDRRPLRRRQGARRDAGAQAGHGLARHGLVQFPDPGLRELARPGRLACRRDAGARRQARGRGVRPVDDLQGGRAGDRPARSRARCMSSSSWA